ncbi:MAG: 50S ribosomal protein L30 [Armatimonadota bacterium]
MMKKSLKKADGEAMIRVTLVKSLIGSTERQRATVQRLGLGKVGSSAVHFPNSAVMGMIRSVQHLLEVEELPEPVEVKNEA